MDSLAPGISVQSVDYQVVSADAAVKYRGFFLQAELYNRWLNNFLADGPMVEIHDWGYYVGGQKGTTVSVATSIFF